MSQNWTDYKWNYSLNISDLSTGVQKAPHESLEVQPLFCLCFAAISSERDFVFFDLEDNGNAQKSSAFHDKI